MRPSRIMANHRAESKHPAFAARVTVPSPALRRPGATSSEAVTAHRGTLRALLVPSAVSAQCPCPAVMSVAGAGAVEALRISFA